MSRIKKRNQKGITLVELMVAIGILGLVTTVGFTYYDQSRKNIREVQFLQVMRTIAKRLDKFSQNPEAIAFSAAQNSNKELANCVWSQELSTLGEGSDYRVDKIRNSGAAITRCTSTDPKQQVPFSLYVPPRDINNYEAEKRRISGGNGGLYYDVVGRRGCNPQDPKCIIKVETYFWATCPRGANDIRSGIQAGNPNIPLVNDCHRAQTINIRYQVSHIHKINQGKSKFRRQLPNIPRNETFWLNGQSSAGGHSVDHANPIDVAQLGRYSDYIGNCKQNETLIYVKDSKPECRCLPPYRSDDGTLSGSCILDGHQCLPTERYLGTQITGEPICQPVECRNINVTGFNFDCRPNGWLTEVRGVPGPNPGDGNCTCAVTDQEAKHDTLTFEETCRLQCNFIIRCCKEVGRRP